MKFFNFILISSSPVGYWACRDDALGTLVPFHRLYYPYSMRRNQLPRNGDPNTSCSAMETPAGEASKCDPLTSSPKRLHSMRVGIQHACERDPYSPLLSESKHSPSYISERSNHGNGPEYHHEERDNDTWLPKLDEHLSDLQNENSYDYTPFCKGRKFIETKVPAMKLQGFNLFLV